MASTCPISIILYPRAAIGEVCYGEDRTYDSSSTDIIAFCISGYGGETPPRQPARRRRYGGRHPLGTALPLRTSAAIAVTPRTPFRDWNSGTQKANSRHLRGFHFPANIICLQLNSQSI